MRTLGSSSPNPSRPRASATNGLSMTGRCSSVLFSLIPSSAFWTLPLRCAAHGNVKSSARLLCPPERQHEFQGCDTPYVHDTVDVFAPEAGTTALGSAFGSREHVNARAWESVRACDEVRSAIGSVDHAPIEMVFTRQCADVSKLMYHMRINGDLLDQDLLVAFDGQSRPLSAPRSKTITGVTCGGFGLRTALGIALPAFVASRTMCPPCCRPRLTTSASPLASRTSPSWQSVTRAPTQSSRALSRRFRRTRLSSCWDSLTKPWPSASFPGATSSLGLKTPRRITQLPPSGTLGASHPTMATGTMSIPLPGNA